jgi:drug/metabolite transporter (DMT)-like permease
MRANMALHPDTTDGRAVLRAAVWMLGSIGAFVAMAVAGRAVSSDLDTFELMFYRSVIGIVLVIAAGRVSNSLHKISTRRLHLQVLRNISHFTGQNLWFWALTVIPLSQLISLEFTQPIWVLLLATVVLGERFTLFKLMVVAIGFGGALLVARPDFGALDPGALAAAGAAIGFAGSTVMTKMLTRTESVICILFWLVVLQALFGLVTAGYDGDLALPTMANLPWLMVLGAAGLLAHMCLTNALMLAPATVVIPFDFLRLPVLTMIGYLFYSEGIDAQVIIGASLILLANLINLRNRG